MILRIFRHGIMRKNSQCNQELRVWVNFSYWYICDLTEICFLNPLFLFVDQQSFFFFIDCWILEQLAVHAFEEQAPQDGLICGSVLRWAHLRKCLLIVETTRRLLNNSCVCKENRLRVDEMAKKPTRIASENSKKDHDCRWDLGEKFQRL